MNGNAFHWFLFVLLSLIWGSSFKLMKVGMEVLSPYEVASLRMLSAGLVLLPFALRSLKEVPVAKYKWVVGSGLLGSFFPAYLFCLAETKIDSSLAGILNALTPIFAVVIAILMYKARVSWIKWTGLTVGFIGLVLLFLTRGNISFTYLSYTSLVLLATIFYGMNVNLVAHHLTGQSSITIASLAFCSFIIPALIILVTLGFFHHPFLQQTAYLQSTAAAVTLGVMGTAIATILYYVLIKRAGGFFAAMVTYGIPFVAVMWGVYSGETINTAQVLCLAIILVGVYMTSLKEKDR